MTAHCFDFDFSNLLSLILYTERISFLSSSTIFTLSPCAKRALATSKDKSADNDEVNYLADDRFEFDPNECRFTSGKWRFNSSIEPLYTDRSCPYLDRQVSCVKNGRPESDYRHWEWQPDDCYLPRLEFQSVPN
ncbi:hypothetical protein POM88_020626 [Heracleum sosnowskyi]|uniref:Trichome birefringence-like N-terminal domain-containing protein n=1 Tax=Heracleum sosnowskyi TaxID=360622 RepID=A0AAD8MRN6_9APIA|nr:hypothetical protein POM88_020626 [Heracleum sosnowskyi]